MSGRECCENGHFHQLSAGRQGRLRRQLLRSAAQFIIISIAASTVEGVFVGSAAIFRSR
jgi:hypothetical protein